MKYEHGFLSFSSPMFCRLRSADPESSRVASAYGVRLVLEGAARHEAHGPSRGLLAKGCHLLFVYCKIERWVHIRHRYRRHADGTTLK